MFRQKFQRRFAHFLARAMQIPRVTLYSLLSNNRFQGMPCHLQPIQAVGMGTIKFEADVKVGAFPSPLFFSTYSYIEARQPTASVLIGGGTCINNNFCAIAEHTSITIGQNCLIGSNVEILDSDFHGIRSSERRESRAEWAKPVFIGDNVFIGSSVKIMKGVSIGNGSVVANGSVVVKDIPSDVIAGGNPARVLKVIGE